MGIANSALKRFVIKVDGTGTRSKGFVTKIDGIGAAVDGCMQGRLITGRAEQFWQMEWHDETRFRDVMKKGAKGKHPTRRFG